MYVPLSPNCSCLVLFSNSPVSATWVNVVSVSAPKPRTAASDFSVRSSPTVASADISSSGVVISTSVSASMSN